MLSMIMSSSASPVTTKFIVGNTYRRISAERRASHDRTGEHREVHDWTLYVDVLEGSDHDHIDIVKFHMNSSTLDPPYFICACPIKKKRRDGSSFWRFSTRQQIYGNLGPISVIVRGRGGTNKVVPYNLSFNENGGMDDNIHVLEERRKFRPLTPVKLWQNKFGIELELTAGSYEANLDDVARMLSSKSKEFVHVFRDYSKGKQKSNQWKLVPDSSIVCNRNDPNCTIFELVSPILIGGEGLNKCYHVLHNGLGSLSSIKVNKSMGFHVHIDVADLSLNGLKKVCQNFIMFEDAMDSFLPPSRRSGSSESEKYFKSNKASVSKFTSTNSIRARHNRIQRSQTFKDLYTIMNADNDRYHKLNLQNLGTGKQSTLEFRQHSATFEYTKLQNWVRFCMALVKNSIRFRTPFPFSESTPIGDQFDTLFCHVIKDRYLRNYYQSRRVEMGSVKVGTHEDCCNGCVDQ